MLNSDYIMLEPPKQGDKHHFARKDRVFTSSTIAFSKNSHGALCGLSSSCECELYRITTLSYHVVQSHLFRVLIYTFAQGSCYSWICVSTFVNRLKVMVSLFLAYNRNIAPFLRRCSSEWHTPCEVWSMYTRTIILTPESLEFKPMIAV